MIILNEREYAEKCLNTYSYGNNIYETLQILAKYYYHVENLRTKRIEKKLLEFLQENYPRYQSNILKWQETVEKISKRAGNYELYENNEIAITKSEIDIIDSIQETNGKTCLRRLVFTLLCLAKLNNLRSDKNNGWVNIEPKEVFKMAHISTTRLKQAQMTGDLILLGLIEIPKKNDNLSIRVKFIDDDSPCVLTVSDFRELGYEYLLYSGENYIRCANCGKLVKGIKNNAKKYCNECSGLPTYDTKTLICIDCGHEFVISSLSKRIRCDSCLKKERQRINSQYYLLNKSE